MTEAELIDVRTTEGHSLPVGAGGGLTPSERGWVPAVPAVKDAPPVPDPGPLPPPTAKHVAHYTVPETKEELDALRADLAKRAPITRWLKVSLDAVTDEPGYWVMVRCSMSDVVRRSLNFEKPETFYWIFGEHNLVFDHARPDLYDMVERDDEGNPLLVSPARQPGDPYPPGGTVEFAAELPTDLALHCFGQAYAATLNGGRTREEKKP